MPHRVLLVEDHPVLRGVLADALDRAPDLSVVGAAATAEAALDVLDGGSACDLVVTDVRLPGMSGLDLVARLATDRPGLPSVVITGHEDATFERRAWAAGAAAFLPKRRAATDLLPTVRAVLARVAGSHAA